MVKENKNYTAQTNKKNCSGCNEVSASNSIKNPLLLANLSPCYLLYSLVDFPTRRDTAEYQTPVSLFLDPPFAIASLLPPLLPRDSEPIILKFSQLRSAPVEPIKHNRYIVIT
ncbi:hypothetical protein M434DRAFT_395751, partial [Hypoxylon sp. CO27-5]